MIRLVFLLISFLSFDLSYSQSSDKAEFKVGYQMTLFDDKEQGQDLRYVYNYILWFNAVKSLYADPELKSFYEALHESWKSKHLPSLGGRQPKSKTSVYKDDSGIIATLPIGSVYMYSYKEPDLKWELIPGENKVILGKSCSLAKTISDTGKVYFAWYSPEIAIPEGPFRFKGLAGLVLEVYNEDGSLVINAVGIEKSRDIIKPINYPNVIIVKNKADFLKKRKDYFENPNSEQFSSQFKAYTMDGKEIVSKRLSIDVNEKLLLD